MSVRDQVLARVNEIRVLCAQTYNEESQHMREFNCNRIATLSEEIFGLVDEEDSREGR